MLAIWALRSSCSLRPRSPASGRSRELDRFSQSGWLLFRDLLLPSPGQENCSFYVLSNSSLESGIAMKANPSLSQSPGPGPGPGTEAASLEHSGRRSAGGRGPSPGQPLSGTRAHTACSSLCLCQGPKSTLRKPLLLPQ